ncbi:alpha/beta fold hydrolase, partial [bacterium]
VFANGILADGSTLDPVIQGWKADGHQAFMTHVPAAHGVETRTAELAKQIDRILAETHAEKVNLVAYSMGTLDARYLVSTLHYEDRVASVTSLSGVAGGTPVADTAAWALRTLPASWQTYVDGFVGLFGVRTNPLLANPEVLKLAEAMSVEGARAFAAENPDAPGVHYQSYAGLTTIFGYALDAHETACGGVILGDNKVPDVMNWQIRTGQVLLAPSLVGTPSDGIVAVESQKHGEFRGCVPTDHWGIIGSTRAPGPDTRTGFDLVRFYRNLAFDLAKRGY